jgi:hypothetical protein
MVCVECTYEMLQCLYGCYHKGPYWIAYTVFCCNCLRFFVEIVCNFCYQSIWLESMLLITFLDLVVTWSFFVEVVCCFL